MDPWEQKMVDFIRHGHKDRVEYLKTLDKAILPSQLKRIQQNDKSIAEDLVLPEWMEWDLLYEWAQRQKTGEKGRTCILCDQEMENGMDFNEKFVCENCFLKIKNME